MKIVQCPVGEHLWTEMSAYGSCLLIGFFVFIGWEKKYVIEKLDIGPVRIRLILFGSALSFRLKQTEITTEDSVRDKR